MLRKKDDSPKSSFQKLNTEERSFSEKQVVEITQQIENKFTEKMTNENKKTENTILRALSSLSENSLREDASTRALRLRRTPGVKDSVQTTSRGLESDQENASPLFGIMTHQDDTHR